MKAPGDEDSIRVKYGPLVLSFLGPLPDSGWFGRALKYTPASILRCYILGIYRLGVHIRGPVDRGLVPFNLIRRPQISFALQGSGERWMDG